MQDNFEKKNTNQPARKLSKIIKFKKESFPKLSINQTTLKTG